MNRHVAHAELSYAPVLDHPQPRVSVVMVVYWTGEALAESIRHVLADPLVDEFVVVDNGSPPEQEEMLRELGRREPRVLLIQGHGNVGFAKAANRGAKAVSTITTRGNGWRTCRAGRRAPTPPSTTVSKPCRSSSPAC